MLRGRLETEARIVFRVSHYDDEWAAALAQSVEAVRNESRAYTPALIFRQHAHRREPHTDERAIGSVNRHWRKQNVPDDAIVGRDQRQGVGTAASQRVDEVRFGGLAECQLVDDANRGDILHGFTTNGDHGSNIVWREAGVTRRSGSAAPAG